MNRCPDRPAHPAGRRPFFAALCALPLLCVPPGVRAQGAVRMFPPQAERGLLRVILPPEVQLNGKPDRLSPGSRIRSTNNLLVLSGSLIGQDLVVNFVRDPSGLLHEVWILSPEEAALPRPTQP